MTTPPKPPVRPGAPPPRPAGPTFKQRQPRILSSHSSASRGGLKVCYWGPNYTGKTFKMLTWPGLVIIQCDPDMGTVNAHKTPVPVIYVADWDEFEDLVLPKIRAGTLQQLVREMRHPETNEPLFPDYVVETVGLDSFTYLAEMAEQKAKELEPGRTDRMYGAKLNLLDDAIRGLTSIAGTNRKPPLNFVTTVHERATYKEIRTDKGGVENVIDSIGPSITGQFFGKFFQNFSTVLLCQVKVPSNQDTGERLPGARPRYFCATIPIDSYRKFGDRYGGGRFPSLPPEVDGSYPELARYWFPKAVK